jgi:hypothetical protein
VTYQCTCPCLDCVEGRHCGRGCYEVDGRVAGVCLEPADDELQQAWREEWTDWDEDVWGGEEE